MGPDSFKLILIGGGITFLGGLLGQFINVIVHYLNRRGEQTKLLRQKCELVADHFTRSGLWWQQLANCKTIWDLKTCMPPIEATQAAMLANLYFPALKKPTEAYYISLLNFYHLLVDNAPFEAGPATVIAMVIKQKSREWSNADKEIEKARKELQEALAAQAGRLLRS